MSLERGILIGLIVGATVISAMAVPTRAFAACVRDSSFCSGCGCKGGPGWRHIASGRCVGFRDLAAKCGDPPSEKLCVFENAPGTGANRDCALAPAVPPPDDPQAPPLR
jgi:hypothetical protein